VGSPPISSPSSSGCGRNENERPSEANDPRRALPGRHGASDGQLIAIAHSNEGLTNEVFSRRDERGLPRSTTDLSRGSVSEAGHQREHGRE
jgi:hypothetical protein